MNDSPFLLGGKMFILLKTDTGSLRTINTDDISYLDGTDKSSTKLFLKTFPDFPIRVGMTIKDLHKVINGEVDFFDVYVDQGFAEHDDTVLQDKGLVKNEKASDEEVDQVKKEFLAGKRLVKGELGEAKTVDPSEIPTFSKKKKKDVAKKVEKKEVTETASSVW